MTQMVTKQQLCAQQGAQMEETSISEHSHPRTSHHITPHMIKVNVMAKLNTVPDSALNEIEEDLDI